MLVIFYIVFVLYIVFLLVAIWNWHVRTEPSIFESPSLSVSIIVAARNEEAHLPALLYSLDTQDYERSLMEIIIVNDHSGDRTAEVVENFQSKSGLNIKLLDAERASLTPKKEALKLGIQHCKGEVLLFTDADCTVPPGWVKEMASVFRNPRMGLAFGPIRYSDGGFLEQLLSQEQAALLGSAFCSLQLGIPSMCNGANMAVRRKTYEAVNGFDTENASASGDDELLLHKVYLSDPKAVTFVKNTQAIVTTQAVETLQQLFQQRKRWAGKWAKYLLWRTKAFAFFIFIFHVVWILIIVAWLSSGGGLFGIALLVKSILEFVFIACVMKFLGKRINLLGFAVLQVLYSPYVVFFGLISRGKSYHWKGRQLN